MVIALKVCLVLFVLLYVLPLGIAALLYRFEGAGIGWRTADRSSIGVLPPPAQHPAAVVRIFSAKTIRWRGIFASHSWIVFKPADAPSYTRYDYTAWGELPIRVNGFEPDGRWFGHTPQVVSSPRTETSPPPCCRKFRAPLPATPGVTRATTAPGRA